MKNTSRFFGAAIVLFCVATAQAQNVHTPKTGSLERQVICDAARAFVLSKYATATLPQPIVFKIDHLAVTGGFCNFEAIPLFKNGSYVGPEYMEDIVFNLCLARNEEGWKVIADLSRTDVPDAAEARTIRGKLPSDFPLSLLSHSWRNLLGN